MSSNDRITGRSGNGAKVAASSGRPPRDPSGSRVATGVSASAGPTTPLPRGASTTGSAPIPAAPTNKSGNGKVLLLGLGLAVVAVVLMNVNVEMVRSQARPGEFTVYRLEASIQPGDVLRERDLSEVRVPEEFEDAFGNAVDATGLNARVGEVFRRSAARGAVLTYELFLEPEGGNLDGLIARDMRLIALPVNPRSLPAVLRPGMFVDIEMPLRGEGSLPRILPVMEYVKVLAVGRHSIAEEQQTAARRSNTFSTISIEVTPQQATQLARISAAAAGDFIIHLRNPADTRQPKIPTGGINPTVIDLVEASGD